MPLPAPLPPRCPGTWLLGNARALLDDTAGTVVAGYRACGPVFRLRAAWRRFTVVAGPEAEEIFERRLDETHLSRHRIFADVEREFGPCHLVLAHGGGIHARLRPLLALAFSRQVASPRVATMSEAVRAAVRAWPETTPLHATREMRSLALVSYGALLGVEGLVFRDWNLVTDYMMNVTAGQVPPIVFRAPWYRRAHRRNSAVLRAALAATARDDESDPPTLLQALAAARTPGAAPLSADEITSYAAYGIGAAIGYVGRLASFLLYELLRDPALLAAVRDESAAMFADGVADARDVRRLPVLRSAYFETLRVHNFAVGMPFDVDRPFEFHGHTVAPGARLIVSPVPSAFDPAQFPEPHRFDAARCREPRNEHRGGGLRAFGLGHRTCSAMGLVEVMTLTLMATLLHERRVEMAPASYRLRRSVWPLPAPDRRFRIRTAAARAGVGPAGTSLAGDDEDRFTTFPGYDQPAVRDAIARASSVRVPSGAVVVREGDVADAFYLVEHGTVVVTRASVAAPVAVLGVGDCFGEAGLLTHAHRNATVSAGPAGATVRVLTRDAFLAMVATSDLVASEIGALLRRRVAVDRLRTASITPGVEPGRALPEFQPRRCASGETIVREGDIADAFFVIVDGGVEVRRTGEAGVTTIATLAAGDYFGEIGLLRHAPRNATVVAGPTGASLLVADALTFERLLATSGGRRGELAMAMLARVERLDA